MGTAGDVDRMKLATIAQAHKMMQDRPERWETITDDAGRMFRRNTATGKMELVTGALKPTEKFITHTDEFGRSIKTDVLTGEQTQVSAAPPTKPLTLEEKKELKRVAAEIPRGDYWSNPTTGDIKWVDSGVNPPEGYVDKVPETRIREVSPIPRESLELRRERAVAAAEQKVNLHKKKEAIKPDIDFVNRNSVGTVGYVWVEEGWGWTGWWPDAPVDEAVRVELPKVEGKQVTMVDVRAIAERSGISIQEILAKYYQKSKGK